MKDTGKISDKGKGKAASQCQVIDVYRTHVKEKLRLDPQRDILKGGMNSGETSKQ